MGFPAHARARVIEEVRGYPRPVSRLGTGARSALTEPSFAPEHADELMVFARFLKRPGPELRIVSLDAKVILAA